MKKGLIALIAFLSFSFITTTNLNSQEEELLNTCANYLKSPYIISGQPFKAFLTGDEVAEFHTTFFSGSTYRVVACSHKQNNIIFSIYDKERNLIFSNQNHENINFWDFKIDGSMECIIEAKLNTKQTTSGIAMLMVGFKSNVE